MNQPTDGRGYQQQPTDEDAGLGLVGCLSSLSFVLALSAFVMAIIALAQGC